MRYTKYISLMVNTQGVPNFTVEQYRILMNVVVLESKIDGVEQARKQLKNDFGRLHLLDYTFKKKLRDLTDDMEPQMFWKILLTDINEIL